MGNSASAKAHASDKASTNKNANKPSYSAKTKNLSVADDNAQDKSNNDHYSDSDKLKTSYKSNGPKRTFRSMEVSNSSSKQFVGEDYINKIKAQDYEELKQSYRSKNVLFEDPLFPPGRLSFMHNIDARKIKWLRPSQICDNPLFISNGTDRYDIAQGLLNDCWFLSALSAVAGMPKLIHKVVPNQSFDNYAGIFHFNIYLFDSWFPVVVDDLLPTYEGELILAHSRGKNEFWVALLEKAYAKVKGSYEVLDYGHATEALFDLTGGITEYYKFASNSEFPVKFFNILFQSFLRSSLICCYIGTSDEKHKAAKLKCGLISHHCYSITNIKRLEYNGKEANLLCLKNPWDKETAWDGAWSDKSKEWNSIAEETKQKLEYKKHSESGEFWMCFNDFIKYFNVFEFCHLNIPAKYNWYSVQFEGRWIKHETAGGCVNNKDTFMKNPKYLLTLVDVDVEDDEDICTVIISLMQKNYRYRKYLQDHEIKIGFVMYLYSTEQSQSVSKKKTSTAIELNPDDVDKDYFRFNSSIAHVDYISKKEVSRRYRLKSGRYLIIPTTFNANEEAIYRLRIYMSKSEENKAEFKTRHMIHRINTLR